MNSSILLNNHLVNKPRVSYRCSATSFYVQSLLQNCDCFERSGGVDRLMYNREGDWVDFEEGVLGEVRDCFVVKKGVCEVGVWVFDFWRMLVVDVVREVEMSVAWIDVEGRCFFPKFVVGGDFEFSGFRHGGDGGLGKLEIEIRVNGGELVNKGDGIRVSGGELVSMEDGIRVSGGELVSMGDGIRVSCGELVNMGDVIRVSGGELVNKRKREGGYGGDLVEGEVKSEGSSSNLDEVRKRRREVGCEEMESRRWMRVKVMGEEGKAGMVVRNLFWNWGGIKGIGAEITGVHQVTRTTPLDKARYEGFLNQVEVTKAARGEANVTFAWIKCSSERVERILRHGFSSPEKASLGEAFGVGIYLSPMKSARVSVMPPDEGENHVILCRLILGKCEKVQAGSQQLYPSSPEYDTGVDDVSNPKWYIVWGANMNTHILPECIVSYKHTGAVGAVSGQLSPTPNVVWMPKMSNAMTAKFFANLIRTLPPSKVPELRTLCCTYKAGKVPKGIFMKKLRSVVGDQMLRAAIQEVRG